VLTVAAAVLLSLIALLAIPVTLQFRVLWHQAVEHDLRLRWAFGLVRFRITTASKTIAERFPSEPEATHRRPDERKGRAKRDGRNLFEILRQRGLRRRLLRFGRDVWRGVHKQDMSLRIRIGLGDPAATGQLWAIAGPIAGMLAAIREASIAVEPEFFETTFELDASGRVRLVPLRMIGVTAALLLSPTVWRSLRQLRGSRR
jgi:hypothetical protein